MNDFTHLPLAVPTAEDLRYDTGLAPQHNVCDDCGCLTYSQQHAQYCVNNERDQS